MPLAGKQLAWRMSLALCYHVGWRGWALTQAVAVMAAESARFVEAFNVNADGSKDRGLFQINDRAHPIPDERAFAAIGNAEYAYELWRRKGWQPWAAFNSGAHRKFFPFVLAARATRWRWLIAKVPERLA